MEPFLPPRPIARHYLLLAMGLTYVLLPTFSRNLSGEPSPNDLRKSERRGPQSSGKNNQKPGNVKMGLRTIRFPEEFRTIDGFGSNEADPEWGGGRYLRFRQGQLLQPSSASQTGNWKTIIFTSVVG
jgi:hypothetical protein